ncbi:trypsin-like serine peptidase [Thermomonospora umbrina]|uniref:V8-like Glu-specific endopeptidase n=1 Tax=Thermomonospora umbrina TaxID=111806 RepID=A0A3D9ST57_9ACTN|nr:peptidase [Thermomonospora umbrina]REE99156.1 V8-like Glu-specific endopeptidase [Thermomonospora umbrina]
MKRSIRTLVIAAGTALLALPAPSSALADDPAEPRPGMRNQAVSPTEQQRVLRYWSEARMKSAAPLTYTLGLTGGSGPTPRLATPSALPNGGGPWTGAGAVVQTAGRVFFTHKGRDASCSGNAVTSGNKSTVITAGHCVKMDGNWHTNWVFVPGYDNGKRPHGTWTARQILSTAQWDSAEDINHDMGAAVVNNQNGKTLTDTVGGQGLAFNQPRGANMYAFGYPAAAPYNGERLIYCSGRVFDDILGTQAMGMHCNMTGGSSGGPWFQTFDEKTGLGTVASVNSFGYRFLPNVMFGPYFGSSEQALYRQAQVA